VANAVLLLVHVPPEFGVRLAVWLTQSVPGEVTETGIPTVTALVVALQPVVALVKVKVTEPAATPVITPEAFTVAVPGALLTHVPPEEGLRLAVLPTHTPEGEVSIGRARTCTGLVVLEQPVVELVYVKVTLPAATPVMTPALVTVAIPVLLLTQVPPVVGERVPVDPTQMEGTAETIGAE
jgi:hypothetical protein